MKAYTVTAQIAVWGLFTYEVEANSIEQAVEFAQNGKNSKGELLSYESDIGEFIEGMPETWEVETA